MKEKKDAHLASELRVHVSKWGCDQHAKRVPYTYTCTHLHEQLEGDEDVGGSKEGVYSSTIPSSFFLDYPAHFFTVIMQINEL